MVPLLLLLPLLRGGEWSDGVGRGRWGGAGTAAMDPQGSLQETPGYELRVPESVRVQKGHCVHVPCSFSYPRSSSNNPYHYIYWYQSGDNTALGKPVATNNQYKEAKKETKHRFILEDPSYYNNKCSLSIQDASKSDSGTYVFRVESGSSVRHTYQDKKLTLRVTDEPEIHIPEPLESGRPTQLTCSLPGPCEGGSPLTFSWAGPAVDSMDTQTLSSSVLTFTPRPQHHGTNLTCQVKQGSRVTAKRTMRLNVFYAPQNLTIGVSFRNVTALKILQSTTSLPILVGEALQLLCVADSNPRAALSWFLESPALNTSPLSNTAILELPEVGPWEERQYTCHAQHALGSRNISLNLSIVYPPQLLGPSCSWDNEHLNCSCSSRANPTPFLRWWLGEGLLEGNLSNASHVVTSSFMGPWANSSMNLRARLSDSLRLSCEAWNVHGAQSTTVLLLPGQSVSMTGVVPAALGGAGAMALLFLCLYLISLCRVKACRRQAARGRKVTNDEDLVMGTVSWGSQKKPQLDGLHDQALPMGDAPSSGEQSELHYANLSFHGRKPREPQDKEACSSPEYSEIKKTSK